MKSNNILIRKLFDQEAFQRAPLGSPCTICFFKKSGGLCDKHVPPCIINSVEYYFEEVDAGDQSPEGYSLKKWNANNTKF